MSSERARAMPHSVAMPKFGDVVLRRRERVSRAFDAVLGMHQAEDKARSPAPSFRSRERREERIVAARDRHRHVNIGDRLCGMAFASALASSTILRRVLRLDEMLGAEIAVAEMEAELDIGRDRVAQPLHALRSVFATALRRDSIAGLAVPDHHLVADIPLDAEIAMRDGAAKRRDFRDHGALIGRLDRRQVARRHEGRASRANGVGRQTWKRACPWAASPLSRAATKSR